MWVVLGAWETLSIGVENIHKHTRSMEYAYVKKWKEKYIKQIAKMGDLKCFWSLFNKHAFKCYNMCS